MYWYSAFVLPCSECENPTDTNIVWKKMGFSLKDRKFSLKKTRKTNVCFELTHSFLVYAAWNAKIVDVARLVLS